MPTDLEVFQQTVAHKQPSRLLYGFRCVEDLKQRLIQHTGTDNLRQHYGTFGCWRTGPKRPEGYVKPDYSKYWHGVELPEGTTINANGVAHAQGDFFHFTRIISPLANAKSLREIEEYPLPDASQLSYDHFPEVKQKALEEGRPAAVWAGHMYETAWAIRGYEQFLEDLMLRPEWAEAILDKLFHNNLIVAQQAAKAGFHAIYCGDDVANQNAMMFSPDMWRHFMLSRWAKVWKAAKEIKPDIAVHYHSDGNVIDIVPDLVNAGVDILNPLQPECLDVDRVYAQFNGRLTFDGCIGTQSTMPFGTPEQVKERVRECVSKYGKNGGLILSPTHDLEPEVPIENIEAFVEACREFA